MSTQTTTATPKTSKRKASYPETKPTSKAKPATSTGSTGKAKADGAVVAQPKMAAKRAATPKPAKTLDRQRKPHARREIDSIIATDLALERISKQAKLIALLRQKEGASLPTMMAATGWQAHSIRGVISGVLRKKLGLNVTLYSGASGSRTYRIA